MGFPRRFAVLVATIAYVGLLVAGSIGVGDRFVAAAWMAVSALVAFAVGGKVIRWIALGAFVLAATVFVLLGYQARHMPHSSAGKILEDLRVIDDATAASGGIPTPSPSSPQPSH